MGRSTIARTDERQKRLAALVLDYCVKLNPHDRLLVQAPTDGKGLAQRIADNARNRCSKVTLDLATYDTAAIRGFLANPLPKIWAAERRRCVRLARGCTAAVYIDGHIASYTRAIPEGTKHLPAFEKNVVEPFEDALYRPGSDRGYAVKWTVVGCPSPGKAREAGMRLEDYAGHFYGATLDCDWNNMRTSMRRIKKVLDAASTVRIVQGETDISFSIKGRGGEICDGRFNLPDGEVAYGPVEDSANGRISFQIPTHYEGYGMIEGIRLEFKNGVVTKASAEKNGRLLDTMLAVDDGAKRLGEFGIGCNPGIKTAVGDILFDEKINGTVHLALGSSYTEQPLRCGGGLNTSVNHQDLICDMRPKKGSPGGVIYADGRVVHRDGVWL